MMGAPSGATSRRGIGDWVLKGGGTKVEVMVVGATVMVLEIKS